MLLTQKNYTQEAMDIAAKVSKEVELRHAKWLASMNHQVDQSQVDKLLSLQGRYCDDVIFSEEDRVTRNQRILLMCEQERVKEKRQVVEDRQKTLQTVINDVSKVAERMLVKKLEALPIDKLSSNLTAFEQFASFAYAPSLSLQKLTDLANSSHQLSSTIADLIENSRLRERGSAAKNNSDVRIAIGRIGVENCRKLFPVLMARPMMRWTDNNIKVLTPKFWQQLVLTANITKMRLNETNVPDPDCGVLIGTLRSLGNIVLINHFTDTFEDALIEVMLNYRKTNRKDEYYACADVRPNSAFLPKVIVDMEALVTKRLVESFNWPKNVEHIKVAILEDIEKKPVLERSVYGAALAQARAYAIYDNLSRSEVFAEKHKPFWFANVQISGEALSSIRTSAPGKMTLLM
ncbi:HDOD domain-containing protein [Vibrio owensii]|uniref:HDOD domain-containing protein n=1 Tax=Vibrio owensii TaxID=696485 RepID=UPI000EFBF065|nr:HDOD domain-containing protein [Vibrio owensii]AYO19893.1 HDOD domain-containing protein [Vibrio owensii]